MHSCPARGPHQVLNIFNWILEIWYHFQNNDQKQRALYANLIRNDFFFLWQSRKTPTVPLNGINNWLVSLISVVSIRSVYCWHLSQLNRIKIVLHLSGYSTWCPLSVHQLFQQYFSLKKLTISMSRKIQVLNIAYNCEKRRKKLIEIRIMLPHIRKRQRIINYENLKPWK